MFVVWYAGYFGTSYPTDRLVINNALRPLGHVAAWLVWHSMRVSLLEDLERPRPPRHRG